MDRPRSRPVYVHPEDQQRETADVRVRQQLQGITVLKELCSKESYQRYLKYSNTQDLDKTSSSIPETSSFLSEEKVEVLDKEDAELVKEVKDCIKAGQKRRRGSNYVIKQKSSFFLNNTQAEVLRLYYPTS